MGFPGHWKTSRWNCRCDRLFAPGIGESWVTRQELFPTRPFARSWRQKSDMATTLAGGMCDLCA